MTLPTGQRGSLVALGILLIALTLVGNYLVVPAVAGYREIREEISDGKFQLEKLTRIANRLPELEFATREQREQALLTPYLLGGQSGALAAANLQQHLREVAELHEARVMSMRVGKSKRVDRIEQVPVHARIQVSSENLAEFLFDLESGRPLVYLETIEIRGRASRRNESAQNALTLNIDLHSLRIPDEEPDDV